MLRAISGKLSLIPPMVVISLLAKPADALPSFAAQTGQPCTACHVGAFGPQLTPLGRAFRIGGYTQRGGEGLLSQIPLSGMVITSFTHTNQSVPEDARVTHYATNNNPSLDAISAFVAGGLGEHTGAFMQITYTNLPNAFNTTQSIHLDNTDIRPYTTVFDLGGNDLTIGASINNNPTVQDPYNTTFAWGYPYVVSGVAPTPAAQPVLAATFAANTFGTTVYAWYDHKLYLEAGVYNSMSPYLLNRLGESFGVGSTSQPAPYLRAAYEWDWSGQAAHVGAIYFQSHVSPSVTPLQTDASMGHDVYTDIAFDAGYQYLGNGTHIGTVQGIYTHESQNLNGTVSAFNNANGTTFGTKYNLSQIRLNASYWYENTYGLTLAWQRTWGPANPVVFAPAELTGSANGKPNSNAFIFETDWVPFGKEDSWLRPLANLKVGLQYTAYTQFNGGNNGYDGVSNRRASDNNTLFVFGWLAF
jgi:hypothetical protein